jgi:hypothetical protein
MNSQQAFEMTEAVVAALKARDTEYDSTKKAAAFWNTLHAAGFMVIAAAQPTRPPAIAVPFALVEPPEAPEAA